MSLAMDIETATVALLKAAKAAGQPDVQLRWIVSALEGSGTLTRQQAAALLWRCGLVEN